MTQKRTSGLAVFLFVLFQAGAAAAVDATISTQVCQPLARNAGLQLTPADDSDLYLSVKDGLTDVLRKLGHPISKSAGLDLYYSMAETAVEIRGQGPSLGRIDVRTVNRDARAQLLVNLWSNKQDSILGGRRSEGGLQVSNVFIVTLELNRQDNGRCVWRGEGAVALGPVAAADIADRLTRAVATKIGQEIEGTTAPLP